jgi:hypothetical protein
MANSSKWSLNEDVYIVHWPFVSSVARDLERSEGDVQARLDYLRSPKGGVRMARIKEVNEGLQGLSESFWRLQALGYNVEDYLCGHMRTGHFTDAMMKYGK